jgi:hypothetical protein
VEVVPGGSEPDHYRPPIEAADYVFAGQHGLGKHFGEPNYCSLAKQHCRCTRSSGVWDLVLADVIANVRQVPLSSTPPGEGGQAGD